MMEITTARLAIIGPRKGQIFVFDRASTTVAQAKRCLKKGQELRVVTITWDDSPESLCVHPKEQHEPRG